MAATLYLDAASGTGWLAHDRAGNAWRAGQPLPDDARVVAVVPAEGVTLHRVSVAARRPADLRRALPFALEDRLAEPVEQLHVAPGTREGDAVWVAVAAQARMDAWLAQLAALGLQADAMVADAHLLPRNPTTRHQARVGERLLFAGGDNAQAVAAVDWPAWQAHVPAAPVRTLAEDGRWLDGDASSRLDRTGFLRLLAPAGLARAPDLLQDAYAPARRQAGARRVWRWAAVLAGLALGMALAGAVAAVRVEQQRRDALQARMAEVFQQALPGARMTADPAAQLAAELARGQGGGIAEGPFRLLAQVAPLVAQGGRFRVHALDWRGGVLEIEVAGADVATIDGLRESLAAGGLAAEVTGVSPAADGVRGRLRLQGAGR